MQHVADAFPIFSALLAGLQSTARALLTFGKQSISKAVIHHHASAALGCGRIFAGNELCDDCNASTCEPTRMINKIVQSMADAVAGIKDGATILIGGFGVMGAPVQLVDGLIEQGARDLTVISNNPGVGTAGMARLLAAGRVRKMVCSFPRTSDPFVELSRQGKIEYEIIPQGTLAERIRAGGAGIPAFYTATSVGTKLGRGKEVRELNGEMYVMETALRGDVALIEAWQGDRWGNLTYNSSARNFNPVMATAGDLTIVQVQHIADFGTLDPECIITPGIFVNRLVHVPYGAPEI